MANIFEKLTKAGEVFLDNIIEKANNPSKTGDVYDRKGFIEVDQPTSMQYGYKEKQGLVSPGVLRNMGRKDSVVVAIHQTRLAQISNFTEPQRDKYSTGFIFEAEEPADIPPEDKIRLADPGLSEEERAELKFELDQKNQKAQKQQQNDIAKLTKFILHCGMNSDEVDTTYKHYTFDKFLNLIIRDRLTYNYVAVEVIPTKAMKDEKGAKLISHFYPVSSGTIRLVSNASAEQYKKMLESVLAQNRQDNNRGNFYDSPEKLRYVQILRGRPVAAWSEEEFIYEAANPSVDPEDYGYGIGELEMLITIVTSHLFAEAHNRNFFTNAIGSKGILHIKGDNLNRAQLEAFKRQWFNQASGSANSFRPPIIGIADDVKWVPLAQSNREMEFEKWMNYLIRICCAVYGMDPAEINFDISKISSSTLNEANNDSKLKSSKDKGLKPLLKFVENIINNQIIPRWDPKLAAKYKFKFVGLDAESRKEEIERLQKESNVWKTVNEIRAEQGKAPIESGDIILAAQYTQYLAQKAMQQQQEQAPEEAAPGEEQPNPTGEPVNEDSEDISSELESDLSELSSEVDLHAKPEEEDKKKEDTKKSVIIEYHNSNNDEE